MHVILYRSTTAEAVSSTDIGDILEAALRRNALWDICGVLLYGPYADGRSGFVQWLEGDREGIESLFTHICTDRRHIEVERLSDGSALAGHAPRFGGCPMRAVPVERLPETAEAFLACVPAAEPAGEAPRA